MAKPDFEERLMKESLVTCVRDGRVATITLNRPDRLNAFNTKLRQDLLTAILDVTADPEISVALLTGAGKNFCVGADLAEQAFRDVEASIETDAKPALRAMHEGDTLFVGAINGAAAGIGAGFGLACDLVIMAEDAYFYLPFSKIGLVPDGGLTWQVVHALGYKRACQAILDADRLYPNLCLEVGLANKVVPADQLQDEARRWSHELAAGAPLMLRSIKTALRSAMHRSFIESISVEAKIQGILADTEDFREGKKAFLEKRVPVFQGK
jgi:2-(1,2-epoxy-1,2-dihydrophenyl)acetyl-CoA isomerase